MVLIIYKCPKCEEAVEGTEADLACSFRDGLLPYWESIECTCGELMTPLVTDSTKGPIGAFLAERYKEASREAFLLHAQLAILPRMAWKVNKKEGAQHKHWRVEIEGMMLNYWPGMDMYDYVPTDHKEPMEKKPGGLDFVVRILDDYELRQATRKA